MRRRHIPRFIGHFLGSDIQRLGLLPSILPSVHVIVVRCSYVFQEEKRKRTMQQLCDYVVACVNRRIHHAMTPNRGQLRTHHMFTQKAICAATLGPFQIHSSALRGMTSLSGSAYANPTPALTITSLTFGFASYTLLALNSPTNCTQLTLVSNWIFSCLTIGGTVMSP